VSCGQCATVCPCNAMMEVNMEGNAGYMTDTEPGSLAAMIDLTKKAEPGYGPLFAISDSEAEMRKERIKKTKTVCTYCGVGCSFEVWTKDREILKVQPSHDSPANKIATCVKGKFSWGHINSDQRLTKPLVRKNGEFHEVEWDEALNVIADNFTAIKEKHGPDALSFISSSKATNEESYLMQKLARQVIGTNNVDNCSRYCQAPATKGLFRTVGHGGDSGSIEDLEKAAMSVLIGTNTAEAHPVIASRMKRAQKLFGQKIHVFDIRKHEMAERADRFYQPKPGTDLAWLSAVTKYIIDHDLHDKAFIDEWVDDFDEYYKSLETFTMAFAEEATGIPESELIKFAEECAKAESVVICWAMGITQQDIGSDSSTAISNLLLVTGNYRRPGTGAYPLRGHNNVQGCSDMGSMPDKITGYQSIEADDIRAKFEKEYGVKLNPKAGKDNHEMVEGIHDGEVHSLYLYGEDTGIVDSNINFVQAAFEKLDFMVVQDEFLTFTATYADVVLPASPSLEKDGTFTNTERRIQRLYQALEPLGDSKPDWKIFQAIANRLGFDWNYKHPSEIMDEVLGCCNSNKETLEHDGTTYPVDYATFENDYEDNKDPEFRRKSFKSFSDGIRKYQHTTAATYNMQVQQEKIEADLRGFESVIDYLLHSQEVTRDMFDRQIDMIMRDLAPVMQKYAKLLQRIHGLDNMRFEDLKISVDPDYEPEISIEDSKNYIFGALSVLGDDYTNMLREAYDQRWIDFAQNKGKDTGAFCASPYFTHSYVFISWTGKMA
ncbi:molybdopterin-dependent oxidoreductase, partial [Staphylococcus aureus]